jgi:hypothetical protein
MTREELEQASADELHRRALEADAAADRAFRRWIQGEVKSASGAGRMQRRADEAWVDLRLHDDYDEDRHGEIASYAR